MSDLVSTRHVISSGVVSTRRHRLSARHFVVLSSTCTTRDLGTTTENPRWPLQNLSKSLIKECLRVSIRILLDRLNDRLHEDMDVLITFVFRWIESRIWLRERRAYMTFL